MKIRDLIREEDLSSMAGNAIRNSPLVNMFGKSITAGDLADVTGLDPQKAFDYGKKAVDVASTKLFDLPGGMGEYTIGDAMIDVPLLVGDVVTLGSMTPALLARLSTKVASKIGAKELEKIAARKGAKVAGSETAASATPAVVAAGATGAEATRLAAKKEAELAAEIAAKKEAEIAAGKASADKTAVKGGARSTASHAVGGELKKNINLDPLDMFKNKSSGSGSGAEGKKRKYNVGDIVPISIKGKVFNVPVVNVLSSGYEVSIDKVPGERPGSRMSIPEPD